MKSPNSPQLFRFLVVGLLFATLFAPHNGFAQAEAESENVLLLQHNSKSKPRYISAGGKVLYRIKGGENIKGQLDQITDSTLIISGVEIYPEQMEMISGKSFGLKAVKVTGGVLMAVGAVQVAPSPL